MAIDDLRRGVGGESARPLGERNAPEPKPEAPRDYSAFGGKDYIGRGKLSAWLKDNIYRISGGRMYSEEADGLVSKIEKKYGALGEYFQRPKAEEIRGKLEYEKPTTRQEEDELAKQKMILDAIMKKEQ